MAETEGQDAQDRTEAPTPRRLEKAREQGQVLLSREVVGFATLCAATLTCFIALPVLGTDMLLAMRGLLAAPAGGDILALSLPLLRAAGLAVLPVLAATAIAAVLATLGQTGWPAKGLTAEFARLNPWTGLKRLVGAEALIELSRTLLKLGAVGLAVWLAVDPAALGAALMLAPGGLLGLAAGASRELVVASLSAFAGVAVLDMVWTRWRLLRQLRMSREDLREEMRESEGDPMLKARRRRIAEGRARRRMLAEVPKAAVVITNPTHYAVALTYRQGDTSAPRLVAKGVDSMAARIRAAAEAHGVPIVSNPPLARALWRMEPDTEIPSEHWQAVAEILAYVWRLQSRAAGGPAGG
ncbi:MAG: flagellar type III secretion system protein FlhB [Acetobacteraceae bacterium]|nr:flagellar type III secretion system protein FlhB [Acetobacteraceae bacterium]